MYMINVAFLPEDYGMEQMPDRGLTIAIGYTNVPNELYQACH